MTASAKEHRKRAPQVRKHWRAWVSHPAQRNVFAAGLTVGLFTAIVQACSLFKEVVVAGRFGAGDQLDAFFIAYLLPSFGVSILGGSLNSALVPAFVVARERDGDRAANAMLAGVTARALALLLGLTALLALSFPVLVPLLATSFSPAKLHLSTTLFYLLLPSLTSSAVAAMWSGVLNADGEFAVAAAAPALVPVAIIAASFLLAPVGVHAVAGGVMVGTVLQCVVLAGALHRRGIPLMPRWGPLTPAIRDIFRQYTPAIGGALLASSTTIVDQSMSAMLGSGSVATFNYGSKLVSAMLGIGMLAIGTAVLPQFSRLAANARWKELRIALQRYTLLLIVVLTPVTIALVMFSEPLVRMLFERGAFLPADTKRVAVIQELFALQVPFYLVGTLVVRLISALRRNAILLWFAGVNVVLNVSFNLWLMRPLGVAGIALSTSFVYVVASTGLFVILWRHIARLEREGT